MLQASKKYPDKIKDTPRKKDTFEDIIVYRTKDETTYNEDGSITTKKVYEPVNLTKKVNETAKVVKTQTASQKLAELEKIIQS